MRDYIKRFLIAIIMGLCVSLLFLGGRHTEAAGAPETTGAKERWIWPSDGVISDTYGTRKGKHKGIDIAGKVGTPILSVEDGVVVKSYFSTTYGNVVFIKHPSNFVTVYAHLNNRNVIAGQKIKQGQIIGRMGKTGQATGPHLHFETHETEWRYDKKFALDPEVLLGKADVGETVQAGVASVGDVLEVSSHYHPTSGQKNKDTYIVKQGDTLFSISKERNTSVEKIKELNQLTTDLIQPKQVLVIQ
ncbi:MAG: peptidoglycan DD-metalloendopeptidase family protein [Bacillus sp. (in: firmicutes)]